MEYLVLTHGEKHGNEIIDDIDRRCDFFRYSYIRLALCSQIYGSISAVSPFPGLRRFPDGRDFSQWTGDDSKALMKVCLLNSDLSWSNLVYALGLPRCHCWPCPAGHLSVSCSILGFLLHSTP